MKNNVLPQKRPADNACICVTLKVLTYQKLSK